MKEKEKFIDELADNLKPKIPLPGWKLLLTLLVGVTSLVVFVSMHWIQSLNLAQMAKMENLVFALQSILLLAQYILSLYFVTRLSVPGPKAPKGAQLALTLLPITLFLVLLGSGWIGGGLEFSVLQSGRAHCLGELLGFSLLLALGMIFLSRKAYVVYPKVVAIHIAVASLAVPLVLQEIFCVANPHHSLLVHFLPGAFLVAFVGYIAIRLIRGR